MVPEAPLEKLEGMLFLITNVQWVGSWKYVCIIRLSTRKPRITQGIKNEERKN